MLLSGREARPVNSPGQELPDRRGDRLGVCLEREVPGLEEADVGLRDDVEPVSPRILLAVL